MSAVKPVADLLRADLEWRRFFKRSCEAGALRLRVVSRQFRDELADRGAKLKTEDVRAALAEIAAKSLPDTPAGKAAKGKADWRDHPLDCECLDCAATMPRYVAAADGSRGSEGVATQKGDEDRELRRMREDAKLAATGVIQSERQVFGLAREYFGGAADEQGGAA